MLNTLPPARTPRLNVAIPNAMNDHQFSEADDRCIHCGTLRTQFEAAPDKSPCPVRWPVPTGLCPEPALRKLAADDADTISARMAELKAAREAAWNSEGKE